MKKGDIRSKVLHAQKYEQKPWITYCHGHLLAGHFWIALFILLFINYMA